MKNYQKIIGQDIKNPVSELILPTQLSRGWESAKNPNFPQTIILQFCAKCDLKQIQFLSHNTKISSKIDIFYSETAPLKEKDIEKLKFIKLGFVTLSSNEMSGYSVRELKSVYLNAKCNILKLVFNPPHKNPLNPYNQVGMISINCIGFPIQEPATNVIYNQLISEKLNAFEEEKNFAVNNEEFDKAKFIKMLIEKMQNSVKQIAKLESMKNIAIKAEEYDKAKSIGIEITNLRNSILINPANFQTQIPQFFNPPNIQKAESPLKNSPPKPKPIEKPKAKAQKLESPPKILEQEQGEQLSESTKLLQKSRKLAERYSNAIKSSTLDGLFSPIKTTRYNMLDTIHELIRTQALDKIGIGELNRTGLAVLGLLGQLLNDNDTGIIYKAINIVETALLNFPFDPDAEESAFFTHLDTILAGLIEAAANEQAKIREQAESTLCKIVSHENIGINTVFWNVTKSEPSKTPENLLLAKLKLLQSLIKQEGEKDKSCIGKRVIDFTVSCAKNGSAKVLNESIKLISECKNIVGEAKMKEFLKNLPEAERDKLLNKLIPSAGEQEKIKCDYCGKEDEKFNTEAGLDWHLYKECPLLMKCPECEFIIEIANLNSHLLKECKKKSLYEECKKCREAIKTEEMEKHTDCSDFEENSIRCSRCHKNIKPGTIEEWKTHILTTSCGKK